VSPSTAPGSSLGSWSVWVWSSFPVFWNGAASAPLAASAIRPQTAALRGILEQRQPRRKAHRIWIVAKRPNDARRADNRELRSTPAACPYPQEEETPRNPETPGGCLAAGASGGLRGGYNRRPLSVPPQSPGRSPRLHLQYGVLAQEYQQFEGRPLRDMAAQQQFNQSSILARKGEFRGAALLLEGSPNSAPNRSFFTTWQCCTRR